MLTANQFEQFKSGNVIRDTEKAKAAIEKDFKLSATEQKKEMYALSGMGNGNYYHAIARGKASIKVILSMAQVLNVNPYYYTGVSDDRGEFTEETLKQFLTEYGYESIAQGKRPYNRKNAAETSDNDSGADISETAAKPVKAEKAVKGKKSSKTKKTAKTRKAPIEESAPVVEAVVSEVVADPRKIAVYDFDCSPKMEAKVRELKVEAAVELVKSLYIRAEAGENAEKLLDIVKHCLLA